MSIVTRSYGSWVSPSISRSRTSGREAVNSKPSRRICSISTASWSSPRPRTSNAYGLFNLQERAELFIGAGVEVYEGMIVGENARSGDMDVNPTKEKKLTNIRTHSHDESLRLTPPRPLTLESALEFIAGDELVEVTPASIRMRKRLLSQHERRREAGREYERRAEGD